MPKYSISKKIILTILLVSNIISLNAQESKKLTYVIKAGTCYPIVYKNLKNQYFGGHDYYDATLHSTLGYHGSFSLIIISNKNYSLSLGIGYQKNKLKIERNWTAAFIYKSIDIGTINSSYITIPMAFNYTVLKDHLELGFAPYLGILIKSEDKGIHSDGKFHSNYNNSIFSTFFYRPIDYGNIIKIDYKFIKERKYSPFIFSEFQIGLINVKKQFYYDEDKWHNINWILGLGIKF